MYGSRAALPHLRETDGAIVNVASIYGPVGGPGSAAHSAAKGSVVNLPREMAVDYASEGVGVNSVRPGFVETPMTDPPSRGGVLRVRRRPDADGTGRPTRGGGGAGGVPRGRRGVVITGANVPVDGGWVAQ